MTVKIVYNVCVFPAMTYGAETWALPIQAKSEVAAAQTKMARSMVNVVRREVVMTGIFRRLWAPVAGCMTRTQVRR